MNVQPFDLRTWALQVREAAERVKIRKQSQGWREWLDKHFGSYTKAPFADRHIRFWDWISSLNAGDKPRARVEVWPRGGAKSTTVELGIAYLGSRPSPQRHYVLYVSENQGQANKHVASIATMLEQCGIKRAINEYGSSKGWRHQEIRTANGFNITAFGLDVGIRGIKLDEFRPDIIVFDDIDGRHDTVDATNKKIDVITTTILPAGSSDCAIIIVQNKIAKDSIVSQLCDERADFLHDRIPAIVEPAVHDLAYERVIQDDGTPRYRITAGTSTWEGQSLAVCEEQINKWGVGAFLREAQHEVDEVEGGLWQRDRDIKPYRVKQSEVPHLDRIVVGVDPNTTGTGDEAGIIISGISHRWRGQSWDQPHGYVLGDYTVGGGPKAWSEAAVAAYYAFNADLIVAEANNGGEMVQITIETVDGAPPVLLVYASRGKRTRAEPVQKLYTDGRVSHVEELIELEKELCSWVPGPMASPNRLDACVWSLTELMLDGGAALREPTGQLADYLAGQ